MSTVGIIDLLPGSFNKSNFYYTVHCTVYSIMTQANAHLLIYLDLENGLVKSSHYIQESHAKYSAPDGQQVGAKTTFYIVFSTFRK